MMDNEENSIGYYAVIPATVLYNDKLKANTKLLYAIITSLANKKGFCYAKILMEGFINFGVKKLY